MSQVSEIRDPRAVDLDVKTSANRMTPAPAGRRFRDALGSGADALLDGVESAASLVPGAPAVTATVRGARASLVETTALDGGSIPTVPGAGSSSSPTQLDSLRLASDQSLRLLELQERISSENRNFTMVSNVMKARHETAKAAINNIR